MERKFRQCRTLSSQENIWIKIWINTTNESVSSFFYSITVVYFTFLSIVDVKIFINAIIVVIHIFKN